jgi:hypothetical protein
MRRILQPCQIHNADQLSEWCLAFLAQNYNNICRKYVLKLSLGYFRKVEPCVWFSSSRLKEISIFQF